MPESNHIPIDRITLEVGHNLLSCVDPQHDKGHYINNLIPTLRNGLFYKSGYLLPKITTRGRQQDELGLNDFIISIHEKPIYRGKAYQNSFYICAEESFLIEQKIPHKKVNIKKNKTYFWIPHNYIDQYNGPKWNTAEFLILTLHDVITDNYPKLVTLTDMYLWTETYPNKALINDIIPSKISMIELTDIFRTLLSMGVCLRDSDTLLETLARHAKPGIKKSKICSLIQQQLTWPTQEKVIHDNEWDFMHNDKSVEQTIAITKN